MSKLIKFSTLFFLLSFSSFSNERKTFIELSWPKIPYAGHYIIQIYKDESLNDLVLQEKIIENKYTWINPPPGKYVYRVAAVDKWKQQGKYSDLSELELYYSKDDLKEIRLIAPRNDEGLSRDAINDTVTFEWEKTPVAKNYQIIVSPYEDLSEPIYAISTEDNQLIISVREFNMEGEFFWQVSSNVNEEITIRSPLQRFFVNRKDIKENEISQNFFEQRKKNTKKRQQVYFLPLYGFYKILSTDTTTGGFASVISNTMLGAQITYDYNHNQNFRSQYTLMGKTFSFNDNEQKKINNASGTLSGLQALIKYKLSDNINLYTGLDYEDQILFANLDSRNAEIDYGKMPGAIIGADFSKYINPGFFFRAQASLKYIKGSEIGIHTVDNGYSYMGYLEAAKPYVLSTEFVVRIKLESTLLTTNYSESNTESSEVQSHTDELKNRNIEIALGLSKAF